MDTGRVVEELLPAASGGRQKLIGIGLAMPGLIDAKSGVCIASGSRHFYRRADRAQFSVPSERHRNSNRFIRSCRTGV